LKKILFFAFMTAVLISCASNEAALRQQEKPPVIKEASVIAADGAKAWITPDMKGKAPFRELKSGEKLKVIKETADAVLVEMEDGARAWVKSGDIK